jgi:hypothetical protein
VRTEHIIEFGIGLLAKRLQDGQRFVAAFGTLLLSLFRRPIEADAAPTWQRPKHRLCRSVLPRKSLITQAFTLLREPISRVRSLTDIDQIAAADASPRECPVAGRDAVTRGDPVVIGVPMPTCRAVGIRFVPIGLLPILVIHRVVGHAVRPDRPVSGSTQINAGNGIGVIAMFEMSPAFSTYSGLRIVQRVLSSPSATGG